MRLRYMRCMGYGWTSMDMNGWGLDGVLDGSGSLFGGNIGATGRCFWGQKLNEIDGSGLIGFD